MATYQISAPDGGTYEITAPDSATQDQVMAYAQQNHTPAPTTTTPNYGSASDFGSALVHNIMNPLHGAAHFVEHGIQSAANLTGNNPATRYINNTVSGDDKAISDWENQYQKNTPDNAASYGGAIVGNVAPFAISGVSSGIQGVGNAASNLASKLLPAGSKLLPEIVGGAAQGATYAATQPVIGNGDYWGNKAKQEEYGAAGGAVMPQAIKAATSIISPTANKAYNALANSGVTTTIGQRLGGALNSIEEKSQSLPFIGDFISQARNRSLNSWNLATLNDVVAPIGQTVSTAGHDGVAEAGDKLSAAYEQGKSMLGGFALDQQGTQGLTDLQNGVSNATNLTAQGKKAFNNMLSLVQQNISPNGSILADGYKELDSKLNKEIASYSGSTDAYQKNLGDAFKQLQSVITDNAKRANPEAAQLLDAADQGWAKLVRVEGASKAAASNKVNTGIFTPGQLMSAVRSADTSVRDRATARGDALMQDWAQNGLRVLGDKVPNSGTFDRGVNGAAAMALLTNPQYIPLAAGGTGLAAALYSGVGQKAMIGAATARPQMAQSFAQALRRYIPTP